MRNRVRGGKGGWVIYLGSVLLIKVGLLFIPNNKSAYKSNFLFAINFCSKY